MIKKYDLTFPQKNIWMVEMLNEKNNINVISGILEINKKYFASEVYIKALNLLVENNDAFRIHIVLDNSKPKQYIEEYVPFSIPIVDMSEKSKDEINDYILNESKTKIDIFSKLYEFKILKYKNKAIILYKVHHIISDAYSLLKIASKISEYIDILYDNGEIKEEKCLSYVDYINTEKEYLCSEKYLNDKNYWHEYLKNIDNEYLSLENDKFNNMSKRFSYTIDKITNKKIYEFCNKNDISKYTLLLSILATYIYRITGNDDIIIGTPILNRTNYKEKQILGIFISTIPLRIKINANESIIDLAKRIYKDNLRMFRHERYPYSEMLKDVYNNTNINSNIYNIFFSYQNNSAEFENDKYRIKWFDPSYIQNKLEIHITDLNSKDLFTISYDYWINKYSEKEIKLLNNRIFNILNYIIDNVNITVDNVNILCDDDKKILNEINATDRKYDESVNVVKLFKLQCEKNPDRYALVSNNCKFTYSELDKNVDYICKVLLNNGIHEKDNIAVLLNRNHTMIETLIAISECGATYIPIDPQYPYERIKYIIDSSNIKYIITSMDIINKVGKFDDTNVINVDDFTYYNVTNLKLNKFSNNNNAYIIYTSGSTGKPKGVMISHKNLINFILGINEKLNINENDVMVSVTTICFDIFELELWLTLVNGAKLVLANEIEQLDEISLNKLCLDNNVNIIQTTPTKLRMLSENENKYLIKMDKILLGGERLDETFINKFKKITSSKIYDVYGPTETTVWSTVSNITYNYINAGKPISNTKLYIVDSVNRVLPLNIAGELCISGMSVSKGYYNNLDMTKEKFIKSNYINNEDIMYKTGDLAKIDLNNNLNILGRIDSQVKINGQRVELGEIENIIDEYKNIKKAIVVLIDKKLVCFYQLKNKNKKIYEDDIRNYVTKKLPVYMLPVYYIENNDIPLTPNGKTDRKKLASYDLKPFLNMSNSAKKRLPQTTYQKIVSDIWKKILNIDEIDIDDNFFEIGGDSFQAIKVKNELLKYNINIDYSELFKNSTIRSLAEVIEIPSNDIEEQFNISGYSKDFNDILKSNSYNKYIPKKTNIGNILLFGATGFLGVHILISYLESEKGDAYCVVRDKNNVSGYDRLKSIINYYFGNKYDEYINKRIHVLQCDISEKIEVNKDLINKIDMVINCAAIVKHYGNNKEKFFKVNIDFTKNIADFCFENNKKLIHISTLSVSGNSFESKFIKQNNLSNDEKIFDETSFYIGQRVDNLYVYTKFKAEEIVLEYMKKGLNANIVRVGNITNRFSDYKFQKNYKENAFLNRIRSIIEIGCIPQNCHSMYLEFTPVDMLANCIIKIAQYFNMEHNLFHAYNNNHVYIKDYLNILKTNNINIDVVSNEEFSKIIKKLILTDDIDKLYGIINDLNDNDVLDYTTNVKIKSDYTTNYLNKLGFKWEKIDSKYIINYINYFISLKYIKMKGNL